MNIQKYIYTFELKFVFLYTVHNSNKTQAPANCIIFVTVLLVCIYMKGYYTAIIHHILYPARKSKILLHMTGTAAALFKIIF